MAFKKIKKVIASGLILSLVLPVAPVNATINDDTNIEIEAQLGEVINEEIENELKNEELDNVEKLELEKEAPEDKVVEEDLIQATPIKEEETLVGKKYSYKKIVIPQLKSIDNEETIDMKSREDVKVRLEALQEYTVLEKMTDKDYEIALAYSDGSYSYVNSTDDYNQAIEEAQEIDRNNNDNILPAVIAKNGQVVYSTNSMGRLYKHINGQPYPHADRNTYIYSDSTLKKDTAYVNQGYVDDVPILQDTGTAAKILVSGHEGWVNKNTSSSEYDLILTPINQAKNPSYYYVENGDLKHFISVNLTGSGGSSVTVGKAPSYLKTGVKYFSYDGIYFYNGSNIQTGLNNLINDYKVNSRGRSVNYNNPYYAYFKYLPFRSMSMYSATEINEFINKNAQSNSKLRNSGQALKNAEQKYGVNALLALGIAINESGWGMSPIAQSKNNIFGLKAYDSNPGLAADQFSSVEECIIDFTKNYISRGYADPADWRYFGGYVGDKKNGANVKYASDPFWGEKAAQHAYLADKYMSGKDNDNYQLAMATTANLVYNDKGTLLYKVLTSMNDYGAYINTPFVITSNDSFVIGGKDSYQIYAERNTPVNSGGDANKYHGTYYWNDKGYINKSGIKLINEGRSLESVLPPVEVKSGSNRFETSVKLSKEAYSKANTVVLVNGWANADGLVAAPLAAACKAPILLTELNIIPRNVRDEIKRLGATKAILIGETGVIGRNVEAQLRELGINTVTRLGGQKRYDTSLEVAKYMDSNSYDVSQVMISYGYGEADAMSIAPVAVREKSPIILIGGSSIEVNTYRWLNNQNLNSAYIIGGKGVVSDTVLNKVNGITAQNIKNNRIGGKNRFETNAMIIQKWFTNNSFKQVYATKSHELVDALTVAPIAGNSNSPIVLLEGSKSIEGDLFQQQKSVLTPKKAEKIIQVGGDVSPKGINSLRLALR